MTEFSTGTLTLPEITPFIDPQHSDGTPVDPEVARMQVDRLSVIVQNRRKQPNPFDITAYTPDPTGSRSLADICIQDTARRISTNAKPNTLDAVDYLSSTLEDRIVKIKPKVEGAPVRGGSMHGVSFLQVCVQNGECTNAAVKAFPTPTKAFAEFVNTQEIARRGISTLEPIAVVTDNGMSHGNGKLKSHTESEPIGYYLSRMETIRSMDRLSFIHRGYLELISGGENAKENLEYIGRVGQVLANMHIKGIFPGDPQLKNFAIRDSSEVIPIDFENVDIFNENFYETEPEKFVDLSQKGLIVLFDSLTGRKADSTNFFEGFTGEDLWQVFDNTIMSAYRRALDESFLDSGTDGDLDVVGFITKVDILSKLAETIRVRVQDYATAPVRRPDRK